MSNKLVTWWTFNWCVEAEGDKEFWGARSLVQNWFKEGNQRRMFLWVPEPKKLQAFGKRMQGTVALKTGKALVTWERQMKVPAVIVLIPNDLSLLKEKWRWNKWELKMAKRSSVLLKTSNNLLIVRGIHFWTQVI